MTGTWNGASLSAQEKAALLTWLLACGWTGTTREAAEVLGMQQRGALHLFYRISRVVPVYRTGRRWRLVVTPPVRVDQ